MPPNGLNAGLGNVHERFDGFPDNPIVRPWHIPDVSVLRLHFTAQDLARVRMTATAGPIAESVFALDLFARNSSIAFSGWRRQVRRHLGPRVDAVDQLTRCCRPLPDLLWLLEQDGRAPDRRPCQRRQVLAVLAEFRRAAVVPYWRRTRRQLEVERDARGRIMITKGVEHLLSTLHPGLRWRPSTLEVPDERQLDVYLDGSGLLLSPSLFLFDRPGVVIDAERETGPPVLAFSVSLNATAITTLCGTPQAADQADPADQALAALIGHTRAAALQALTDPCTTSELAQRLNISSAGASQHATVLREAGLITTCRNRNTALHSVTRLGMDLLRSADPAPAISHGRLRISEA